jgi:hypothetical protein
MAAAAVTPRVRTIIICDDISASETEEGVFNLEGVRQRLYAESFPWRAELSVLLLLSSARKGRYPGRLVIVRDRDERVIRYLNFLTAFQGDNELLFVPLEIGSCVFPAPGPHTFRVSFTSQRGEEALKGEHPFAVLSDEE